MYELLQENRRLLFKLCVVAVLMFGFGFALIPFYNKICEVTGVNQLVKADEALSNGQIDISRKVRIQFDANVRSDAVWRFKPERMQMDVHPGQLVQVQYTVENGSGRAIVGQAIPSYGPSRAGEFVKKLDCFCFKQQSFKAGEVRRMPVVFVLDSAVPKDVHTITLSYSFFEVNGAGA